MPVLINIISDQHLIHRSVEKALSDFSSIKHKLTISPQWDGGQHPVDIVLLDDYSTFRRIVSHYNASHARADFPTVIFVSDEATIAKAVTENTCNRLMVQYFQQNRISPENLFPLIRFAAEETLFKREQKSDRQHYKSLFERVQNPAFILSHDWEFVKVNPAFEDYFRSSKPQVVRTNFEEILLIPADFDRIATCLKDNPNQEINEVVLLKSASRKKGTPVRLQLCAIKENTGTGEGQPAAVTGYNGSFLDVTGQKFMEDLQMRMDNLAMTYRLARRLAHEIRNPLTNVTLAIDQLKEELPESSDDGGTDMFFGIINRSVKRIGDLIEQLLQGAEPKQLQLQETNIVSLTRQVLHTYSDKLKLHQIEIEQRFEQDIFLISLDRDKYQLALTHLLNNAIEAIGKNENGCITVGSTVANDQFCIYVQDNGVGIAEDVLDKLFTPFFTSKNKGIGFGLTSTQSILAEHGALMEVESDPGDGSVFSMVFPLSASSKTGS